MNTQTDSTTISTQIPRQNEHDHAVSDYIGLVSDITMATGLIVVFAVFAEVPDTVAFQSVTVFFALTILTLISQLSLRDGLRMGPADKVTLMRAAIAAMFAGFMFRGDTANALGWWLPAIAGIALVLDGVDGWIARRTGTASAFGARFDLETDAFFILVLSALAWQLDKVGPWVLAIGAMRYGFLAAGTLWSRLRAPLFASRRRQTICVIQVAALVICLLPVVGPQVATATAATALIALICSFAVDTVWLLRQGDGTPGTRPPRAGTARSAP